MRAFFDFEFTGLHQLTTPISLGIVMENGEEFYAEFTDYDRAQITLWVEDNVLSGLFLEDTEQERAMNYYKEDRGEISSLLTCWLRKFGGTIEFWGDCLSYDWVLFNSLFGDALSIPKNVSYIPFDICTLFEIRGIDSDCNREEFARLKMGENDRKHNALWDAKVIKKCYERLTAPSFAYEEGNKVIIVKQLTAFSGLKCTIKRVHFNGGSLYYELNEVPHLWPHEYLMIDE
ncbi:3'-5' exoribonuclease [compost metagenome]